MWLQLANLTMLDVSNNKLRSLPVELGDMISLCHLYLNHNQLRVLPYELGKLFRIQTLGLQGNPLSPEISKIYHENNGAQKILQFLLDHLTSKSLSTSCLKRNILRAARSFSAFSWASQNWKKVIWGIGPSIMSANGPFQDARVTLGFCALNYSLAVSKPHIIRYSRRSRICNPCWRVSRMSDIPQELSPLPNDAITSTP